MVHRKKPILPDPLWPLSKRISLKRQVATASNLLQGLAPGVTVTQQSGRPGADGASIRIRGLSSIYAGQSPLIMVDGVVSSLDAIDPNAIESITILKDAASTAYLWYPCSQWRYLGQNHSLQKERVLR